MIIIIVNSDVANTYLMLMKGGTWRVCLNSMFRNSSGSEFYFGDNKQCTAMSRLPWTVPGYPTFHILSPQSKPNPFPIVLHVYM